MSQGWSYVIKARVFVGDDPDDTNKVVECDILRGQYVAASKHEADAKGVDEIEVLVLTELMLVNDTRRPAQILQEETKITCLGDSNAGLTTIFDMPGKRLGYKLITYKVELHPSLKSTR